MKTASGAILRSVFFGPGRFCLIFGSNLGPRLASLGRLSADFRDFLANCGPPCDLSSLEGARGCSGDRFCCLGEPPGKDFGRILGRSMRCFGRLWPSIFVPIFPKFGPIPDQLLFYRLCLTPVALPSSCRGGGPPVVSRSVLNSP